MSLAIENGLLEKNIEIGIAIEIEKKFNSNLFDPDFDPEKDISMVFLKGFY